MTTGADPDEPKRPYQVFLADAIHQYMLEIKKCFCERLDIAGLTPRCGCFVYHGQGFPPADEHAYIRWSMVLEDPHRARNWMRTGCRIRDWHIQIELGLWWCVEVGDAETQPTPATREIEARKGADALAAMLSLIECCEAVTGREALVQQAQPLGPAGGLAGAQILFTSRLFPSDMDED